MKSTTSSKKVTQYTVDMWQRVAGMRWRLAGIGAGILMAVPSANATDFGYSKTPLFVAVGAKPNVMLVLDDSGSMQNAPKSGGTTSKITTLKADAKQVVNDNASNMNIGLFHFYANSSSDAGGKYSLPCGSTATQLNTAIQALNANNSTPLASSLYEVTRYFRGLVPNNTAENGASAFTSPIQYRCQKNFVVVLTDGKPTSGMDYPGSGVANGTLPKLASTQDTVTGGATNPWGAYQLDIKTTGTTYDAAKKTSSWDGYPDPKMSGDSSGYFPLMDDVAQFAYDVDMKSDTAATKSLTTCTGTGLPSGAGTAGKDCAGKSWDDPTEYGKWAKQNLVTYTIGFDVQNEVLRDTPLVNRKSFMSDAVDVVNDTIKLPQHGLETGDYLQYYGGISTKIPRSTVDNATDVITGDASTFATGSPLRYGTGSGTALAYALPAQNPQVPSVDTATDVITGDTSGIVTGATVTYDAHGGAALQDTHTIDVTLNIPKADFNTATNVLTGDTSGMTTSTPLTYNDMTGTNNDFTYKGLTTATVLASDVNTSSTRERISNFSAAFMSGMATGDVLTYNRGTGTALTFAGPFTQAVPAASVNTALDSISGLVTNGGLTAGTSPMTYSNGGGADMTYVYSSGNKVIATSNVSTGTDTITNMAATTNLSNDTAMTYAANGTAMTYASSLAPTATVSANKVTLSNAASGLTTAAPLTYTPNGTSIQYLYNQSATAVTTANVNLTTDLLTSAALTANLANGTTMAYTSNGTAITYNGSAVSPTGTVASGKVTLANSALGLTTTAPLTYAPNGTSIEYQYTLAPTTTPSAPSLATDTFTSSTITANLVNNTPMTYTANGTPILYSGGTPAPTGTVASNKVTLSNAAAGLTTTAPLTYAANGTSIQYAYAIGNTAVTMANVSSATNMLTNAALTANLVNDTPMTYTPNGTAILYDGSIASPTATVAANKVTLSNAATGLTTTAPLTYAANGTSIQYAYASGNNVVTMPNVNLSTNVITAPTTNLTNGTAMTYTAGGTAITYASGATTTKTVTTANVSTGGDTVTFDTTGLKVGDALTYTPVGTPAIKQTVVVAADIPSTVYVQTCNGSNTVGAPCTAGTAAIKITGTVGGGALNLTGTGNNAQTFAFTQSLPLPATVYASSVSGGTFKVSLTSGGAELDLNGQGNSLQTFSYNTNMPLPSTVYALATTNGFSIALTPSGTALTLSNVGNAAQTFTYQTNYALPSTVYAESVSGSTFGVALTAGGTPVNISGLGNDAQTFSYNRNIPLPSTVYALATTNGFSIALSPSGTALTLSNVGNPAQTFTYQSYLTLPTTVYATNVSGTTFQLALTSGGAAVNLLGTGNPSQTFSYGRSIPLPSTVYALSTTNPFSIALTSGGAALTLNTVGNAAQTFTYVPLLNLPATVYAANVSGSTFGVSLTSGGAAVDIVSTGNSLQTFSYNRALPLPSTVYALSTANPFSISLTQGGTALVLPGIGNAAQTFAYTGSVPLPATVYANSVNTSAGTFKLALTAGGAAIDINGSGNNNQAFSFTATVPVPASVYACDLTGGNLKLALTATTSPCLDINGTGNNLQTLTYISNISTATTFYAIPDIGNRRIKLASSSANATAGTALDLTGSGNDTQTLSWYQTKTGTTFYPILTCVGCDATHFKLAESAANAAAGIAVDIVSTGNDAQTFSFSRTVTNNTSGTYYAIVIDATHYKLALTAADATTGKALDITAAGNDAQTTQFDGAAGDGTVLYVIKIDDTHYKLAKNAADAANGIALDLTGTGNDGQVFISGIVGGLYTYETDYEPAAGTAAPATDSTARGKYCVIKVDADRIKLANAYAGSDIICPTTSLPVDLTTIGTGTVSYGPGKSYFPKDAAELSRDLNAAFTEINNTTQAASSVAADSSKFETGTITYQGVYNPAFWSGNLKALQIVNGNPDAAHPVWQTLTSLKASPSLSSGAAVTRTILTFRPDTGKGVVFGWGNLSPTQKAYLANGNSADATTGQNVESWLYGNNQSDNNYRLRPDGLLGDILGSSPVYLSSTEDDKYSSLATGGSSYNAFVKTKTVNHPNGLVFVGANDGMLHGFTADGVAGGIEKLAYIPNASFMSWLETDDNGVYDVGTDTPDYKLFHLTQNFYGQPSNPHRYFVDGSPAVHDAYIARGGAAAWHSVLVGGMNSGGRAVYALDVTDDTFTSSDVMWEFTDPELGYTYSQPVIGHMADGSWAAIFGNGYDSKGDKAQLFIVDLATGALIKKIDTGVGSSTLTGRNGLSSPAVQLGGSDGATVQAIYAGDLQGNVWKFDVSSTSVSGWVINNGVSAAPLFTAKDTASPTNPQPITSAPMLEQYSSSSVLVHVNTGKYFELGDGSYSPSTTKPIFNSVYALLDKNQGAVSFSKLKKQWIIATNVVVGTKSYFSATANPVDYAGGDLGWYMNMITGGTATNESTNYSGILMSTSPVLVGPRVLFTALTPKNEDQCQGGGVSHFVEVNSKTGAVIGKPIMDTNGDGVIDSKDTIVAGFTEEDGIMSQPTVLTDSAGHPIKLFSSTSTTEALKELTNEAIDCDEDPTKCPVPITKGRMSWRELK